MDCGCNCFGIAASSRKPVKRYNLLMPALFGKEAPPATGELDASANRRIKKVVEYCEKNPHRVPKVQWRHTSLLCCPPAKGADSSESSAVILRVQLGGNLIPPARVPTS